MGTTSSASLPRLTQGLARLVAAGTEIDDPHAGPTAQSLSPSPCQSGEGPQSYPQHVEAMGSIYRGRNQ